LHETEAVFNLGELASVRQGSAHFNSCKHWHTLR